MTYWRTVRWLIAIEAVAALWWFVWGWSDAALVAAAVSVGTAGYYLLTPHSRRQAEDAVELAAAPEERGRRR